MRQSESGFPGCQCERKRLPQRDADAVGKPRAVWIFACAVIWFDGVVIDEDIAFVFVDRRRSRSCGRNAFMCVHVGEFCLMNGDILERIDELDLISACIGERAREFCGCGRGGIEVDR